MNVCQHCSLFKVKARGLCSSCYKKPAILKLYPVADRTKQLRPTTAVPGSEEKIRVLQRRFANRVPLFQPGDLSWTWRLAKPTTYRVAQRTGLDDL